MPVIGVLHGMETTFPSALAERINSKKIKNLSADPIRIGGLHVGDPCPFDVIIDRISHDIDFYQAYLKNAALNGTVVLNNPFRWAADDKVTHRAVAELNGISVPRTALIPQKTHPPGISGQSLRNLQFPLNWDEIFDYVQFPAYLKPLHPGAGWLSVQRVESSGQFFGLYDQTGSTCMLLQAAIDFDAFYRAYVVGSQVRLVRYDRTQAQHRRHSAAEGALLPQMQQDAAKLCRALGYDINAVDFAVKDGTSYVIDSFNLAPEADVHSVGTENFEWLVGNVADLAIDRALHRSPAAASFRMDERVAAAASALP